MSELFDEYATDYDGALEQGISISGENKLFFARGRVSWLKKCLEDHGATPRLILDFGCGTGTATPFLLDLGRSKLIGLDTSEKSLQHARRVNDPERTEFLLLNAYRPSRSVDLAFCNGVFHHVPPEDRESLLGYIFDSLRNDGFFSFWENNPWNPGTRIVMRRIPFDRDAKTITPAEARRMLKRAGFHVLRTDFLFIFPHFLRWFRPLETLVTPFPFGAQYQILCRKD
jgi:SAM-dependent methyltransferase